jgi:hypothetical protein
MVIVLIPYSRSTRTLHLSDPNVACVRVVSLFRSHVKAELPSLEGEE